MPSSAAGPAETLSPSFSPREEDRDSGIRSRRGDDGDGGGDCADVKLGSILSRRRFDTRASPRFLQTNCNINYYTSGTGTYFFYLGIESNLTRTVELKLSSFISLSFCTSPKL